MNNKETSKIRLLAVERIIQRGERVTISQILRELDLKYDIQADRKSIAADIRAIDRFMPIESIRGRHGGYQVVDVLGMSKN